MNISEIISTETIDLSMRAVSKEACIEQMSAMLAKQGAISDANTFVKDVLIREASGSTGIGFGVAIPHGKSAGVQKTGLAFVKLAEPIEWKSLDDKPVSIVFLIAVPLEQAGTEHLKILTTLARKLVHESFRNELLNAQSADDILTALQF